MLLSGAVLLSSGGLLSSAARRMRRDRPRRAFAGGVRLGALALALAGCASGAPGPGSGAGAGAVGTASAVAAASTAGTGGQVLKGLAAQSVSFVSTTEGFVLGTGPNAPRPSTVIARTTDRGAHWTVVSVLSVPVGDAMQPGQNAVWGIRFVSARHGFVYGRVLLETTDGGARWKSVPLPGGEPVQSLAVSDGQVLAFVARCGERNCPEPGSAGLYRRALSGGAWPKVASLPKAILTDDSVNLIAAQGKVAAVLDGTQVLVTGDGGLTVTRHPTPCSSPDYAGASNVAVLSDQALAVVCHGQGYTGNVAKTVCLSGDLGARWHPAGSPPAAGDPIEIAGTPGHLVVAGGLRGS